LRITPTRNLIFTGHFNITLGEEKIRIYKLSKNYVAKQPCLLDNVETIMKKTDALGQFEQLVLTAVLLCGEKAYGMAVHEKVEELGERRVKLPSVYVTLDRLEEKGYVKSWLADPTPERGGRRKRYFRLLAAGERAMAESGATAQRILDSWRTAKWPSRTK